MIRQEPPGFDLVVSAENNDYMAWQCFVLHHSSLTQIGQAPIFVVHGDEPELVEGFRRIQAVGGRVQRQPNFRHGGAIMYAPRNQMKTVELVATNKPWLILLDADMILLGPVDFDAMVAELDDDTVGLDRIPFLVVHKENRPFISDVCAQADLDLQFVEDHPINGATPYLISTAVRDELCQSWDPMMELYLETAFRYHDGYDPAVWISSMWGLVFAMHKVGLEARLFDLCVHTTNDPVVNPVDRPILHYSYDNDGFNKRKFQSVADYGALWSSAGVSGRTSGAVCDAIRAAGALYREASRC